MKNINYKSDFDFILRLLDADGTDIGIPRYDWTVRLWTSTKANAYIASCSGGILTNCYDDNGRLHIVADNHRLSPGILKVEFIAEIPDSDYPDGLQRNVIPATLDIQLITGPGDLPSSIEADLPLPLDTLLAEINRRLKALESKRLILLEDPATQTTQATPNDNGN